MGKKKNKLKADVVVKTIGVIMNSLRIFSMRFYMRGKQVINLMNLKIWIRKNLYASENKNMLKVYWLQEII